MIPWIRRGAVANRPRALCVMKRRLILSVLTLWVLLIAGSGEGRAAETPLPARTAEIDVEDARFSDGQAVLTLTVRVTGGGGVSLLDPRYNGEAAAFGRGDPDVRLDVPDSGSLTADVTVRSYGADEACDAVSFRFGAGGAIQGTVSVMNDGPGFRTDVTAPESPLIETAVIEPETYPEPVTLRDRLAAERVALLDYGQAVVCLRREDGVFLPLCAVPATVSEDGAVSAVYSGLLLTLDGSDVLFSMTESRDGGDCLWESGLNTLTGEAIEYAEMTLTLRRGPDGAFVTGQSFDAWETGGVCESAPCDLFDVMLITQPLYAFEEAGDLTVLREIDSRARRVEIEGPLSLCLRPAEELGDVWVYFEYFFSDRTDEAHAPFALKHLGEDAP